jgi:hypothetical protein
MAVCPVQEGTSRAIAGWKQQKSAMRCVLHASRPITDVDFSDFLEMTFSFGL